MIQEEFRPVVGYDGYYEVGSFGTVRSIDRIVGGRSLKGINLAQVPDRGRHSYGRLQVKLSKNGKAKTRITAHLVAEAFIGQRPLGHEVAHEDGNCQNNTAENLRYDTPLGNTADKFKHGTVLKGEAVATAKLKECEVLQIRGLRGIMTVYQIAEMFSTSIANVSRIQTGKRWGHVI
jgi:hypothetical protein